MLPTHPYTPREGAGERGESVRDQGGLGTTSEPRGRPLGRSASELCCPGNVDEQRPLPFPRPAIPHNNAVGTPTGCAPYVRSPSPYHAHPLLILCVCVFGGTHTIVRYPARHRFNFLSAKGIVGITAGTGERESASLSASSIPDSRRRKTTSRSPGSR